jgi:hypothetical protein
MAKNKKKKSSAQQQSLTIRELIIKQENEYKKGLTEFLQRIDMLEHMRLLPSNVYDNMIRLRISSARIESEGKDLLSKEDQAYMRDYLKQILLNEYSKPYYNNEKITWKEFIFYLITLSLNVNSHIKNTNDEKVEKAFGKMISYVGENIQEVLSTLQFHLNFSATWMSDPINGYINYSKVEFDTREGSKRTLSDSWCSPLVFKRKCISPNKLQVAIDGKKREVFEMVLPTLEGELVWCTIAPKLLKKNGDTPIRVFIQKHALNRMDERLDFILNEMQYFFAAKSVVESTKIKQIGEDNYLIPVLFYGRKLGYLVAHYVDSIMVITTFLFITQEGTPEGMLLNKLTGFKMLDKKYLCIDKLSTFINSDIASKPELVKLLQDAKLGHLVDLYDEIKCVCLDQEENLLDPSFIMDYIQKKQEEDQLSLTEQQEMEVAQAAEEEVMVNLLDIAPAQQKVQFT